MMYRVLFDKRAKKEFDKLHPSAANRVLAVIQSLAANPRPGRSIKLKGRDNQYRVRSGDYRILYLIHDSELIVVIIKISLRKDVYR